MNDRVEHRIGIAAPASVIWEVIADFPAWGDWNPIYPKAEGRLGYGERLTLTEALPDRPPREINPALLDWTPDEALHWRRTYARGFGWAVRFLEIEALSETGCVFSNGEIYGGWMGEREFRAVRSALRPACTQLGEAVKARAESLWRERSGGAT